MGKQLSVRIDDELEDALEAEKEKHAPFQPSDSDIVREALREYLAGNLNSQAMVTAD